MYIDISVSFLLFYGWYYLWHFKISTAAICTTNTAAYIARERYALSFMYLQLDIPGFHACHVFLLHSQRMCDQWQLQSKPFHDSTSMTFTAGVVFSSESIWALDLAKSNLITLILT